MDRLTERLDMAARALATLQEALRIAQPTTIERDAAIKRFEYSVETAWKAAQQYLRDVEGVDVGSPKGAARACRDAAVLTDAQAQQAITAIDDRNLATHTYNEELAKALVARLPTHLAMLQSWLQAMQRRPKSP
jgi:nucleotidyltransferase substrate binding protein (TIGR01987 family)